MPGYREDEVSKRFIYVKCFKQCLAYSKRYTAVIIVIFQMLAYIQKDCATQQNQTPSYIVCPLILLFVLQHWLSALSRHWGIQR